MRVLVAEQGLHGKCKAVNGEQVSKSKKSGSLSLNVGTCKCWESAVASYLWSPLRSVTCVQEITLRRYLPALRGCFTVSLTVFNICFPCNRPLACVRFLGGCSDGGSPCMTRSLLKLLATSAAWPGTGWQPPCAWLQRRAFRSICAGKITRCWITFQKEGNKIPP